MYYEIKDGVCVPEELLLTKNNDEVIAECATCGAHITAEQVERVREMAINAVEARKEAKNG